MVVYIGINGFGRIGRIIFRKCFESSDLEVAAINDPAVDTDYICYLIKFDSTHGRFSNNLMFTANEITIDDKKIKVFHEKLPSNIPWHAAGVHYVVEASGMFTNHEKASSHLASGTVKRVIVTAPSVDIPMMILGVNEEKINTEQKVISCASSTLYCLAPLIKVLEDKYGIAEGFITSIHAMTPSLKPLDGLCLRGKHWRDHRSILQNIIPAATGACKALGRIIPQVKNKMTGLAFRVPIVNVSVLDVTIRLNSNTTMEDIIKCIENESQSTMKNIINTSSEEVVSSDFLGDINSCILDKNSSLQLTPNFFKLICWYENEYSYACRVVDSIMYSEKCFQFDNMFNIRNKQFISNRLFPEPNIPFYDEQIFIVPSYKMHNNLLLSMSQDKNFRKKQFKSTQACRLYECFHSGISEDEQKNEIFEIWNDEVRDRQPKVRENIQHNTFCHSCITVKPPDKILSISKESTPLENKGEIARMKHNINTFLNKPVGQTDQVNVSEGFISDTKSNRNCKNCPMSGDHVSCDSKLHTDTSEANKTPKDDKGHIGVITSKFDFDLIESKLENDNKKKLLEEENVLNKKLNSETRIIEKNTDIIHNELNYPKSSTGADGQENNNIQIVEYITNIEYTEKSLSNPNTLNVIDGQNNKIHSKDSENDNNNSIAIGIDEGSCKSRENTLSEISEQNYKSEIQAENNQILNMKKHLQKKILAGIVTSLSAEKVLIGNELPSLSAININNTISNADRLGNHSDIFDKLDSVSGTDSENSFQIKERKSQVLKITDLTTSLEDLARLDKICKIIEISDDLSDRLFSVLDTTNPDFRRNNWSFKDLCERLKLDEFYNNVFIRHSKF